MKTRTIELSDTTTVTPAAGGRLLLRSSDDVEVVKPSTGRVWLAKGKAYSTLGFGTAPSGVTLMVNGPHAALRHLFEAITGVTP